MTYSIADFWKIRLGSITGSVMASKLPGWEAQLPSNPSFVEADLHLRAGFEDLSVPIWLVAAPGAVGKSTLAREISAQTGAAYLDLAKAATVAGNYLTGGLVKSNFLSLWQKNQTTVLIDALDEARLRVTQNSFEDFLCDVKGLSVTRTLPTILFGRVGIIEEAWSILAENGLNCPIFDIDFFDSIRAERFVIAVLERLATEGRYRHLATSLSAHRSVYKNVAKTFIERLSQISLSEGNRFAGYAPVLEAVATDLAAVRNPANLQDSVTDTLTNQVLAHLSDNILDREATKVRAQLGDFSMGLRAALYTPNEQLDRLAATVLATQQPSLPVGLSQQETNAYANAIRNLLPQHPFLDGTGKKASGAVFAAVINAHALFSSSHETVVAAEIHAGRGPHSPNPFLIDFYLDRADKDPEGTPVVPPEHVVALYESVRARVSAGEVIQLSIESEEDDEDLDAEIVISASGTSQQDIYRRILFKTSQAGELRFGRQVSGVSIDAPSADLVIGTGNPVELIAPVSLSVGRLSLNCPELVAQSGEAVVENTDTIVTIEAQELLRSEVLTAPHVRKGAELALSWPGVTAYPWTHFATFPNEGEGKAVDEALRRIRRLILAFRSHSKGRLARFKDKIEHRRITKGALGVALREQMLRDGILSLEGDMYFLDSSMLGRVAGVTYQDIQMRRFSEKVRAYVSSITA